MAVKSVDLILAHFAVTDILVSDDTLFASGSFRKMCFSIGNRKITTSPCYPQPPCVEMQ